MNDYLQGDIKSSHLIVCFLENVQTMVQEIYFNYALVLRETFVFSATQCLGIRLGIRDDRDLIPSVKLKEAAYRT